MTKKTLAFTLTALTICMSLSACGNSPAGSSVKSSIAVSSSSKKTESKLIAGMLEQNNLEISSRRHWTHARNRNEVRDKIKFKAFSSLNTMLMELNTGKVDFLQLPTSVGNYLAASDDKLIVKYKKTLQHYDMAARADDTVLSGKINKAIAALKADGTLKKLAADYITNADSAPATNTLVEHKGAKTYTVAVTGDLPPLDYVSADGAPAGFNVALLNAISKISGCNFKIVQLDAAARLSALESGKVDLIFWIGCYSSKGFEPKIDGICLSTPYYEESTCCVSHSKAILDKAMPIYQSLK